MPLLRRITAEFFRAPRRGTSDWIPVVFGSLLIALSILGSLVDDARGAVFSVEPAFVLLGVAFVLMGGAELLPADRRRLAALLRLVTVGAFIGWFVALVLTG